VSYDGVILGDTPLYAFWPLKESSGTTAFDASNAFTGTYSGGFTLGQAGIGDGESAVLWNGSTGQAAATYAAPPAKPYSLECWAFLTNTSQNGAIAKLGYSTTSGAAAGDGIAFGIGSGTLDVAGDNLIALYENVAWHATTTALTASVWHHIVLTIDASGAGVLYLDGSSVLSIPNTTPPANPTATAANLFSGGYTANNGVGGAQPRYFAGDTAKFAVYKYALTSGQVAAHYNAAIAQAVFPVFLPRNTLMRGVRNLGQMALFRQRVPTPVVAQHVFAATLGDTSLSTDVLTRVLALPRPLTDTSLSADSLTRIGSEPRPLSDTSLSTDALSRVQAEPRPLADSSLSTDQLTRVLHQPRLLADTSASSDVLTRTLALPRPLADTSLSTDTLTRVDVLGRSSADTSVSADALTRGESEQRPLADASLSSDALTRSGVLYARTVADTSASTDLLTRSETEPRPLADTSLSSDSVTAVKGTARSSADTSLCTDALTRVLLLPRPLADSTLSADALTPVTRFPRTGADTSLSSDAVVAVKGVGRFPSDTSLSTDALTRVLYLPRPLADTSASTDAVSTTTHFARPLTDASLSADALTPIKGTARSLADTSLSTDATTRGPLLAARVLADTSLSSDSVSYTLVHSGGLTPARVALARAPLYSASISRGVIYSAWLAHGPAVFSAVLSHGAVTRLAVDHDPVYEVTLSRE
jgi:hypothetical protein